MQIIKSGVLESLSEDEKKLQEVYMYMYMYSTYTVHTHVHVHVHTYTCMYMCTCMYCTYAWQVSFPVSLHLTVMQWLHGVPTCTHMCSTCSCPQAIFEVVTTEATYLRSLDVLIDHFMDDPGMNPNLPEGRRVLDKRQHHVIFSNVKEVREISAK